MEFLGRRFGDGEPPLIVASSATKAGAIFAPVR